MLNSSERQFLDKVRFELSKRKIDKDGFVAYCNANGFELARHHHLMAEKLERVIKEPGYNLMIFMPPGHAKSTYSSVLFPSYFLGRFTNKSIIMVSHTAELAAHFGRRCRKNILEPSFQYIFDAALTNDSKSADRFNLTNGSEYYACGVGGAITGRRADIGVIDDPVKSREDADSETIRNKTYSWYVNDFRTRLKPGANQILIMTRWHEDDLAGRILSSPDKGNWDVISLPAIAELDDPLGRKPGEALWPEYISLDILNTYKKLTEKNPRPWNALYQQKPSAEEGDYFRASDIQIVPYREIPKDLKIYGGSDYAVTADRGDYTVHIVIGYDDIMDNVYVLDVWREQTETNVWIAKFIELCLDYEPLMWAEESGQIIKSLNPFIEREMLRKRCGVYRKQYTSSTEKTARARSLQGLMAEQRIYIADRDWTDEFVSELLKFPTGKYDDQVDALSVICRMLEEMVMKVRLPTRKEEYEYRDNKLTLPGLDEKINFQEAPMFHKF